MPSPVPRPPTVSMHPPGSAHSASGSPIGRSRSLYEPTSVHPVTAPHVRMPVRLATVPPVLLACPVTQGAPPCVGIIVTTRGGSRDRLTAHAPPRSPGNLP